MEITASRVEIAKAFVGAVNSRRHQAGLNPQGSTSLASPDAKWAGSPKEHSAFLAYNDTGCPQTPSPSGHNHQLGCEQGRALQGAKWQEKCGTRME